MKKNHFSLSALTLALIALPAAALANGAVNNSDNVYYSNNADSKGVYVQGDLGLAHVRANGKFNSIRESYNDSNVLPRISVGYDFGPARIATDYTHYGRVDENRRNAHAQASAQSIGVSGIYDFPINRFQPYVGARVSSNHIKRSETTAVKKVTEKSTKLGVGLLAGVGYQIDNHLTLDAGYRYNHLDSDLRAHEATVGLRYKF